MKRYMPWKRSSLREAWRWPHIFWLNMFGLWAEEADTPRKRAWFPLLRVLVFCHAVMLTVTMIIANVEKFAMGDIMTNMFTVFATGIATTGFFKMFQIVIHRRTLKGAMDSVDGTELRIHKPEMQPKQFH